MTGNLTTDACFTLREKSAEAVVAAFARGEAAPYTIPVVPGQDVRIESPRA
jgi:hypothetical protein